jgi:FAD binding domain/Berberine and berberine like
MRRWYFFCLSLLTALCAAAGCAHQTQSASVGESAAHYCIPGQSCWPTPAQWQQLRAHLAGTLEEVRSPVASCKEARSGEACSKALQDLKNPFAISDLAGGTQSTGWLGAWEAAPSAYAVAVKNSSDVAAAVSFGREHKVRLAIKGTGHDYQGRSNAPDSLLIWTHHLRNVTVREAFVAQGCSGPAVPAVSVEAGARWIEVYQEVTGKHHRYVQGGGCTSVGAVGGFLQGGGFGSWSKKYGTAAAGMLEAEVVTASGEVVIANACQNQDLFWALRGGGGGTFGIVTKATLMTHPLPKSLGFVLGGVQAKSDAAFKELLEAFIGFYAQSLHNESWGEQVRVGRDNSLRFAMSFHDLTGADAESVWRPFLSTLEQRREDFSVAVNYLVLPPEKMWDEEFIKQGAPDVLVEDQRPEGSGGHFWWASNQEEVAAYWYAYESRWMPFALFQSAHAKQTAAVLFTASRQWPLALHFNKGQAGASSEAIRRGRETAMNPVVYDAAALVIIGAKGQGYPGVTGMQPDTTEGALQRERVASAMRGVRELTPVSGSYLNEGDYFESDWQRSFWGENYSRLLQVKHKYDPEGLFTCHHCVGSEQADAD